MQWTLPKYFSHEVLANGFHDQLIVISRAFLVFFWSNIHSVLENHV